MSKRAFTGLIHAADGGGAYIELPFDVESTFGGKRPKVKATFDGEPYRGTAVRMGSECHLLIIVKAIRTKIGKEPGDTVKVVVEADSEPRIITAPTDFAAAMRASRKAHAFWKSLSYTHQREYVQWIEEARRADTRERRIIKAVAMLENNVRSR